MFALTLLSLAFLTWNLPLGAAEGDWTRDSVIEALDLVVAARECELAEARAELKRMRENFHLAQVELGEKSIEILKLDAKLDEVQRDLALARSKEEESRRIADQLEAALENERSHSAELRQLVASLRGERAAASSGSVTVSLAPGSGGASADRNDGRKSREEANGDQP